MAIEVTEDQVQEQIDKSYGDDEQMLSGASRWPGMTYEQGVQNALNWVLGNADTGPMDEE